jgi:hypothetical protein
MDLTKRERLIALCGELEAYNGGVAPVGTPLVTLEEYFDGADGNSGIFCNTRVIPDDYLSAPDDSQALELLTAIRSRPDVSDVRIVITQIGDGEWPFSDTIAFVTTAAIEDVFGWFPEGMKPDEVYIPGEASFVRDRPTVLAGHQMAFAWFD